MCGISGFVGRGELADLERMNDALIHRGPDAGGIWRQAQPPVFFGHRRLSIIDLAGGAQPMSTADGDMVITFNGEIYNHEELRGELKARGHVFRSDHSDTEVLLHGYREWGRDLPGKLNGMWAFALYDRARRRVFLCRDRFGKKPLFYTRQSGVFAFASELSALTKHALVPRRVSGRALQKYFAYGYIPAPLSIYEGIHKLPGGWSLWLDAETLEPRLEKYWEFVLEPFESEPANPEEEWGGRLLELLDRAVKRRLMSDVPLGVFLSGGIDSSAITALAARHVERGRLQTFSVGFEEASFDESRYARQVAAQFGTVHHEQILSMTRARELASNILARLDEPIGDSSLLPTSLLCRFARQRVTVALGGDGGDELFAGYDPFLALRRAELYQKWVPRPVHLALRLLVGRLPVSHANLSLDFKLKRTLRGLDARAPLWAPVWMGPLAPGEIAELFSDPLPTEELYSEAIEAWEAAGTGANLVDRTLQFFTRLYLQNGILVKADRASMMHGLEVRAPFLDIDVVDFARRIPARWKLRHGKRKFLLKQSLKAVLPASIVQRPKKGFGVPVGAWLKEGAIELAPTEPASLPLSQDWVRRKLAQHRAGTADERLFLWSYHALSQWSNLALA